MDNGRFDMRDSERVGTAAGLGECSWLSFPALVAGNEVVLGSLAGAFATDGLAGAGDAGFAGETDAEAADVLRRCSLLPPHSDMKERTANVLVAFERAPISEWCRRGWT